MFRVLRNGLVVEGSDCFSEDERNETGLGDEERIEEDFVSQSTRMISHFRK